jgi:hypothetical protein
MIGVATIERLEAYPAFNVAFDVAAVVVILDDPQRTRVRRVFGEPCAPRLDAVAILPGIAAL